jgi:poly(hydroxyalkanoate) depolymerase family esterase
MNFFARYPAMAKALQATRSSGLADATALINATLSAHLPSAPGGNGRTDDASPQQGGAFPEKTYTAAGKTLSYRLYVPANATAGMPLVVMLHGCTQSAEDFARGTQMNALADRLGFLVAYPSQTHAANAQKCWNWFKPSDQRRDQGEPALIAGLTRQIIAEQHCDEGRVYIAGLSAGGAAAAVMASAYPDLYAAVGIHSGLPCGAARDISSALMAMKQGSNAAPAPSSASRFVPVITFHGDRDATVSEINSRNIIAAATSAAGRLSTRTESGQVTGGHRYTRALSRNGEGETLIEQWTIHGGGHAWSGGSPAGSYTDKLGPDASAGMMTFFLAHRRSGA